MEINDLMDKLGPLGYRLGSQGEIKKSLVYLDACDLECFVKAPLEDIPLMLVSPAAARLFPCVDFEGGSEISDESFEWFHADFLVPIIYAVLEVRTHAA